MAKPIFYNKVIFSYAAWWLFWAVLQTILLQQFAINLIVAIADGAISTLLLGLSGFIIVNTYRFYTPGSVNYLYGAVYIIVLTLICVTATQWILQQIFYNESVYIEFLKTSLPIRFMFSLLMISFMAVASWLRFYMNEQDENIKRKSEALQLFREAELAKLRQQLQPHFLFNSLNSISALAGSRPEEARKMIQQLSDFLRGTLKKDEQQLVNFSEELEHLQLYLEIEKVRFGNRLNTQINCDDECKEMQLPSLLLQPIVENAIKFGLYDTIGEITISIAAEVNEAQLIIQVQNPFDPTASKPKEGAGFGLNSVQRRLYLLYAQNDLLNVEQKGNLFITTLKIPQGL